MIYQCVSKMDNNITYGRGRAALFSAAEAATPRQHITVTSSPGSRNGESSGFSGSSYSSSGCGRGFLFAQCLSNASVPSESSFLSRGRGRHFVSDANRTRTTGESGVVSLEEDLLNLNLSSPVVPSQPSTVSSHGTCGTEFNAFTNWISLRVLENKQRHEYNVQFIPSVDAMRVRRSLIASIKNHFGGVYNFDGTKLWLPKRLERIQTVYNTVHPTSQEHQQLIISLVKQSNMADSLQFYNVLFTRVLRMLDMVRIQNNYFSTSGMTIPQHKLEIWPGYSAAIHVVEGKMESNGELKLCLDIAHKVLRSENVYDIIIEAFRNGSRQAAEEQLLGSTVLTRYNNKTYRIDDILWNANPQLEFDSSDGMISYMDYYKKQYNIAIKDKEQPMLVHKLKKKELREQGKDKLLQLVPELCYLTGLTDKMRADFKVMKDVASYTRLTPQARVGQLSQLIRKIFANEEACKILLDWGLEISNEPYHCTARALPQEKIFFGNGKKVDSGDNCDWTRNMGEALYAVDLNPYEWAILFTSKDAPRAQNFRRMMVSVCQGRQSRECIGMRVGDPHLIQLPNDRNETYVQELRKLKKQEPPVKIVVIIFPTRREDRYSSVKKVACCELGMPTQCINSFTISREDKLRSITHKIALQINCKLGGFLWTINVPKSGLMICGVDVYHDGARHKGQSVVGFVASYSAEFTKWYSQATFQRSGEEVLNCLQISLRKSIQNYHRHNHCFPKNIVIYRDGVSEGYMKLVQEHEIPQLMQVLKQTEGVQSKLALIIVQKRISTRILERNYNNMYQNPKPGSLLDHSITHRDYYDFYLVSQHVREGTVSPTHYFVLYDETGLKVDHMQRLTYKMTHMYYNWPGTIRVPAPCQYAHRLAYLIGQNTKQVPHADLEDTLFYL